MILSILVAVDEGGGIGFQNRLPWHLSADLKRFKKLTMGHHLLVGRKTYQSIGGPLSGRRLMVLSRQADFPAEDGDLVGSPEEGLDLARSRGENELFIIGGFALFKAFLPTADHLYLTRVHTKAESDVFFPDWNEEDWVLLCEQFKLSDPDNDHDQTFKHYRKKTDGI
jgi:dihydrofolate reductase